MKSYVVLQQRGGYPMKLLAQRGLQAFGLLGGSGLQVTLQAFTAGRGTGFGI
jgi:hypothetical protein